MGVSDPDDPARDWIKRVAQTADAIIKASEEMEKIISIFFLLVLFSGRVEMCSVSVLPKPPGSEGRSRPYPMVDGGGG